ncbi:hypothetical protein [Mumia zhuanghuii]|uniref:hypothetical protein n=1 Tax=Mumia zhuanghuii TaxID=2585211 RepID=UPI00129C4189|nr:hypothetical protein [Mumia zhuanghuii]
MLAESSKGDPLAHKSQRKSDFRGMKACHAGAHALHAGVARLEQHGFATPHVLV